MEREERAEPPRVFKVRGWQEVVDIDFGTRVYVPQNPPVCAGISHVYSNSEWEERQKNSGLP